MIRMDLAQLDATAQAELVARRECTPGELVEAAIERIERVNPRLNAVVVRLFEQARAAAASPDLPQGPFRGVPLLLKDLGCPAIGVPLYWTADGLPLGIQLVARYGGEDSLLRLASQLEAACPWRARRPQIHA